MKVVVWKANVLSGPGFIWGELRGRSMLPKTYWEYICKALDHHSVHWGLNPPSKTLSPL